MAEDKVPIKSKSEIIAPRGVTYIGDESYEYQLFPEEYFSGADLSIYFGDVWVDELISLQFTLLEQVRPVYGYASRTWDWIARGNRIVAGQFKIAFKEAGYLTTILSHLGMLEDGDNPIAPKLAYYMHGDQDAPQWYGSCQERIEDLLDRYHNGDNSNTSDETDPAIVPAGIKILNTDRPSTSLKYGDTDGTTGGWVSKAQTAIKNRYTFTALSAMSVSGWPTLRVGSTGNYVRQLQQRLKDYWCDPGIIDGNFGQKTREAVISFQTRAKLSPDGIVGDNTKDILSRAFTIDGDFGSVTRLAVYMIQAQEKIQIDGIIGPQTAAKLWPGVSESQPVGSIAICPPEIQIENGKAYAATRTLTNKMGIPDSQISYDSSTQNVTISGKVFKAWKIINDRAWLWTRQVGEAFGWTVSFNNATGCVEMAKGTSEEEGTGSGSDSGSSDGNSALASEPRMTQFEQEIWGRRFSPNAEEYNKRESYFYRGKYPSKLRQTGFDIYSVYGPLAQYAINKKEQYTDNNEYGDSQLGFMANFNTTVKAVRNIQIKSCGQVLDASGTPIEEVYTFIAQDLD